MITTRKLSNALDAEIKGVDLCVLGARTGRYEDEGHEAKVQAGA